MAALLDSGFIYATVDASDKQHARVTEALRNLTDELLLPTVVLVEVTYLLQARLGHAEMRLFVERLQQGPIALVEIVDADIPRIHELLDRYADARLDFVDAAVVTLAERLDIRRILTVDQRDFRAVRPMHCDFFDIVP